MGAEFASNRELAADAWRAQQADALIAIAKAYVSGGTAEAGSAADHYQVVVHVDDTALRGRADGGDCARQKSLRGGA